MRARQCEHGVIEGSVHARQCKHGVVEGACKVVRAWGYRGCVQGSVSMGL